MRVLIGGWVKVSLMSIPKVNQNQYKCFTLFVLKNVSIGIPTNYLLQQVR